MTKAAGRKAARPPGARLGWAQVRAWRLRRHHLDNRVPHTAMVDVAGGLCGLHAQLMSSAELALWARVEDLEVDAVARALWEERTLVKTWAMRGTLHLLPAAELPLWQAALSTYRHYRRASWLRYFGLTADELDRLISAVARSLDGSALTREELAEAVSKVTSAELGDKLRESWGALLKPAAYLGHICFAPSMGQRVRFTRPDQWLASWRHEDPTSSLGEVVRRFLAVHGPATREDLARWWGTTPASASALLEGLGDAATPVDVGGRRAWMLTGDVAEAAEASLPRSVRLLPAFDQYVVAATTHATELLPGPFKGRVYRPQGWLSPMLLVDGRMDGVWRHERKGSRLAVRIEPFVALPASVRRGVEEEAERLARFTGGRLDLTWG